MRDTRAGARPSTAPIGLLSNLQWEGGEDELIAVRIEGSELLLPRSSFPPPAVEDEVLPAVARAPGTFHSCDRFVDECIPPVSVPRAFGVPVSATMQFEEIHKMFHDLIVSLFYGDDAGESELPAYKQKERQRQRRARRNNTRLIYLLENIIPLVSQGLTELTHALVHRQKHLSKILPQCFVENGASAYSETVISNVTDDDDDEIAGLSGESLIQPPGGALVWLARYMIRHNPTRPQSLLCAVSKDSAKDIRIARKQRQYAAILAKCLREYDNWQTCKAQHDALKQVELRHIWDAIDTNDDGTLDISEVGKALVQLGFRLSDEDGSVTAEDDMKEEFWALELAEIEQLFSALDVDGSGDVDFDEFVLGTSRWFYGRQMMARAVFDRKMDSHHLEHSSDMAELLQSLARQRMIRSIQAASLDSAKLFSKIDKENSGFVNYDAFHKGILELASVMSGKSVANGSGNGDAATGEGNTTTSSAKHIVMVLSRNSKRLFAEIDTDGDGLISLEEFQRFFVGYIDSSIEEKARQAAHRIEIEQEDHIRALVNQGHVTLRCADRALAAQQLRLDTLQRGARTVKDNGSSSGGKQEESKTDADRLAELRESIGRLQIELGQDSVDENALAVLQEARAYLGGCMEAVQAAERLCNMAASDIDSAHEAITAALNQATSATRLADLQGAVGELSVTDHRRSSFNSLSPRLKRESASLSNMTHYEDGNLTIVEASDKSIKTLTKAVSMAEEIIAGSSQTLMNLKNAIAGAALRRQQMSQRRAIDDRRNKRRENERRKAEEAVQRHRIEAAEKSYEAMRKRKLGQKNKKDEALRQEQEESDAAIEEAREREREAAERERILRAEAANAAEERRAVRREIRRVEFTKQREEEEKAREEKYREEEAGREAQKIIESFQPDNVRLFFFTSQQKFHSRLTHSLTCTLTHSFFSISPFFTVGLQGTWERSTCCLL
jgi:Ca2+-binding EF-hand superfamily protein